jgi:heme/copper-type cytochrome/quinol oxidase subunit 4
MNDRYKYGIGFWSGAGIYSLINMFMNLNHRSQSKIWVYNCIITGVAIVGLILCIYLLNRRKED